MLKNVGNDSLRVTNVTLSPGSHEGLAVEDSFVLEPEDERDVYVAYRHEGGTCDRPGIGWLQVARRSRVPAMV